MPSQLITQKPAGHSELKAHGSPADAAGQACTSSSSKPGSQEQITINPARQCPVWRQQQQVTRSSQKCSGHPPDWWLNTGRLAGPPVVLAERLNGVVRAVGHTHCCWKLTPMPTESSGPSSLPVETPCQLVGVDIAEGVELPKGQAYHRSSRPPMTAVSMAAGHPYRLLVGAWTLHGSPPLCRSAAAAPASRGAPRTAHRSWCLHVRSSTCSVRRAASVRRAGPGCRRLRLKGSSGRLLLSSVAFLHWPTGPFPPPR